MRLHAVDRERETSRARELEVSAKHCDLMLALIDRGSTDEVETALADRTHPRISVIYAKL
jgi:hypothetical protein